ncbi:30S ribosome-binding factor RbfA [Pseudomonas sp. UL073]|uniref:Ribosome-binding factor A n=1 Tax=Zestomonas insulae TaxID=2809017 RepID=A0ABS2IJ35_9GAMM|nr:30S ribosome-binding factor RbfA [Pseudomonas insulae]MBM7063069.1 30S ribosome-binding factor RbfA [Pseudomonas insulae]
MGKDYSRTQRIGDQMQRELSDLIRREIKDPRLGMVTITAVEVSRDLGHAKVFTTVMSVDGDEAVTQSIKVLNDAAGFLRMQLARAMKLRSVPQLHFHYDESVLRGTHLSALIERAVAEDNQHRAGDDEE